MFNVEMVLHIGQVPMLVVYIASTHVQLAGCDNVKHIENECIKVPIL